MKKVYFLGPEGTFSHQVALEHFKEDQFDLIATESLTKVVDNMDENSIGILPIENSSSNNVHQSIDLIIAHDLFITQEASIPVNFNLIGLSESNLDNINTVIAHPMTLLQCSKYIQENQLQAIEAESNMASQIDLLEHDRSDYAALSTSTLVAPERSIVLQEDVANYQKNITRFAIVQKNIDPGTLSGNKVSILFKTSHQPGSLSKILSVLADNSLNLTKIESRPIPETDWEYLFWIDIEIKDLSTQAISDLLSEHTSFLKIIGLYKAEASH